MAAKAALCSNGESEWRTGNPTTPTTVVRRSGPGGHRTAPARHLGQLAHELSRFWSSHDCRSTVAATASIPTRRARLAAPHWTGELASGPAIRRGTVTGSAGKRRRRSASTVVRRSSCKTTGTSSSVSSADASDAAADGRGTRITRQSQRKPHDDQAGIELRHESRDRPAVRARVPASSDHRVRGREHTLRVADRHADAPLPEVDPDHSSSHRRPHRQCAACGWLPVGQACAWPSGARRPRHGFSGAAAQRLTQLCHSFVDTGYVPAARGRQFRGAAASAADSSGGYDSSRSSVDPRALGRGDDERRPVRAR